jgi:hypothetical protein
MPLPLNHLSLEEWWKLEKLIEASIVERYDGLLVQTGERYEGASYAPADTEDIRDLLAVLWGKFLTPQAIDDAFARLADVDDWPHGYREEGEPEWFQRASEPD